MSTKSPRIGAARHVTRNATYPINPVASAFDMPMMVVIGSNAMTMNAFRPFSTSVALVLMIEIYRRAGIARIATRTRDGEINPAVIAGITLKMAREQAATTIIVPIFISTYFV